MLYKLDSKQGFGFYHMGIKVHINYISQISKSSPMFNQWLICLWTQCCIKWKGLEMVDKMCDFFCLKHGRICKNAMIRWIIWNNQHFLFLSGNKCLAITECFLWNFIFWEIEMYFWMFIWGYTSIVESFIYIV